MTHRHRKGDRVAVLAAVAEGIVVEDGAAIIIAPIKGMEERYTVRLSRTGEKVERYVDPLAQSDPEHYAAELTRRTAG